jgi:hypothetical protein
MFRKALLLATSAALVATAGCRNAVAPKDDTIGGTLGSGNTRSPVSGWVGDGAETDSTTRIGGTLGSGH